ncbi:hypothetical protein D3C80_1828990 [compost metagenome]
MVGRKMRLGQAEAVLYTSGASTATVVIFTPAGVGAPACVGAASVTGVGSSIRSSW